MQANVLIPKTYAVQYDGTNSADLVTELNIFIDLEDSTGLHFRDAEGYEKFVTEGNYLIISISGHVSRTRYITHHNMSPADIDVYWNTDGTQTLPGTPAPGDGIYVEP